MPIDQLLEKAKKFELDTYKQPESIAENHIAFSGAIEKHPHDSEKVIVVADPFSANVSYFEFRIADIKGVEELSSLVTVEGKSVRMFLIWVKKGSVGIRFTPFIVEDTRVPTTG